MEKEIYGGILIAVSAATNALVDKNLDLDSLFLSLFPVTDLNVCADDYDNDARNSWGVVPFSFLAGKTRMHPVLVTFVMCVRKSCA